MSLILTSVHVAEPGHICVNQKLEQVTAAAGENKRIHTDVGFVGSREEKRLLDPQTFRRLDFVHGITTTRTDWSTVLFIRHSILV